MGRLSLFERPRCTCRGEEGCAVSSARRKPEDTAEGCRALADADRERAAATPNDHMRASFNRSASAWVLRANLLDRLQASFDDRATANAKEKPGIPANGGADHG